MPAAIAAALPDHAILKRSIGIGCANLTATAPGTVHSLANLTMYTTTMAP
jgi:hypothetical protein